MKKEVKVKILNMTYNEENHLFQLYVKDVEEGNEAIFAIRATDWGIPYETPSDMLEQFCKDMTGKEKNLFIELDTTSTENARRDSEGKIPPDEMDRLYDNLYEYPINEIVNIQSKSEGQGSES